MSFFTFLTAIVVAYIAVQQYILAKAKLKLDLFERRLKIFNALEVFLATIQKPDIGFSDLNNFHYETSESSFLFGDDVRDYLENVSKKAAQLHAVSLRCRANGNIVQLDDMDLHTELTEWVISQRLGGAREVFRKYLSFDAWH